MARRVRVASRAIRRGRRLRARQSDVPTAIASTDDDPQSEDTGASDEGVAPGVTRYSRPPAPTLSFDDDAVDSGRGTGEAEHRAQGVQRSEPEMFDEADEVALARRSRFSRPPAPTLRLGEMSDDEALEESAQSEPASDVAPQLDAEDEADANAMTLISARSYERPSRPPSSEVAVEHARDEEPSDSSLDDDDAPELAFHDGETGPDFAGEMAVPSSLNVDFFHGRDSSLSPTVEDLPDDDDPPSEVLTPMAFKRRRGLRRGVGIGVGLVGLATLVLVARSTMTDSVQHAERHQGTAAAVTASEVSDKASDPAKGVAAAEDAETSDDVAVAGDEEIAGDEPAGDYAAVSTKTLELLNDRNFEDAVKWANQLIELKPKSAFGYRCLGAALQDLGRITEARDAYSKCVTYADSGEVEECTALGGARLRESAR